MNFKELADKLEKTHRLIKQEKTGDSYELASQLGVNRSTAYRYLNMLRAYNIRITYNKRIRSYCYDESHEVVFACGVTISR